MLWITFKGGWLDKKAQTWRGKTQQVGLINKGRFTLQEFDGYVITIFGSYFIVEIEYNFLIIFQCGDRGVCHGGHPHDWKLYPWRRTDVKYIAHDLSIFLCLSVKNIPPNFFKYGTFIHQGWLFYMLGGEGFNPLKRLQFELYLTVFALLSSSMRMHLCHQSQPENLPNSFHYL